MDPFKDCPSLVWDNSLDYMCFQLCNWFSFFLCWGMETGEFLYLPFSSVSRWLPAMVVGNLCFSDPSRSIYVLSLQPQNVVIRLWFRSGEGASVLNRGLGALRTRHVEDHDRDTRWISPAGLPVACGILPG